MLVVLINGFNTLERKMLSEGRPWTWKIDTAIDTYMKHL